MRFSKAVVKHRAAILIVALILMVPSFLGMAGTRINYDMLDYLPDDMDTVVGQNELTADFGKGAFSLLVVEDMEPKDVAALKGKIEQVKQQLVDIAADGVIDGQEVPKMWEIVDYLGKLSKSVAELQLLCEKQLRDGEAK